MPFSSQTEAKQLLANLIEQQAQRQGEALSDVERRLLLFSVEEPESAEGIPKDRLIQDDIDLEFEQRTGELLKSVYKMADPEQRKRIAEAIREVNKGDHYIALIAKPVLCHATTVRDKVLYVAIGLAVTALSILYAIYR